MTGVEIPTPNSGLSMMTSSIKDNPNNCDNDRLPKIARLALKSQYCHFRLSVVVAIARSQFLYAGRGRKLGICRWNCHPICRISRDRSISGFGVTLPFPVVGHCHNHLATLYSGSPLSKISDLPLQFSNFDAICCSSCGITISGFGGYVAISGCRSML